MTFWCRIKQSQIRNLSNQLKVCCFLTKTPALINQSLPIITTGAVSAVENNQSWFVFKNPSQFGNNVRFFAAPVQVKPKKENDYAKGPRLNEEITVTCIRLVTDEGHEVISRHEALKRAKMLKLDLVEVQRDAKPPVCKIMDYHKEKYQKELKEKERSKSKAESSVRKGAPKEVRITGKIEQKDLQMKANTIKRLMERGYRVKCMATGTEHEDVGGLLSKLAVLIEDFSVVESGPSVERRQAYVIVRHAKFGPSKKGVKQKNIIVPPSTFNSSTDSEEGTNGEKSNVGGEEDTLSETEEETPALENRYKTEPVNRYKTGPASSASPAGQMDARISRPALRNSIRCDPLSRTEVESPAPENRYKTGPPNRYRMGSENRVPSSRQMNANQPDLRNSTRLEPSFQNQINQRQFDSNTRPPSTEIKQGETHANGIRGNSPSNYGLFGSPKANDETQRQTGPAEVNRYKRGPNPNSPPSNLQGKGKPFVRQRRP